MGRLERYLGALVAFNNAQIERVDVSAVNPLPPERSPWRREAVRRWPQLREEWDRYASADGGLPPIEDLLLEHQGNIGPWRIGLLVANGRPVRPLADSFPATMEVLAAIPRVRSAMWSELSAGTELPEHTGPNKGVLRYHLGISCPPDSALRVGDTVVAYRDGDDVLFDDTAPHAAWNRGPTSRITLFCELIRPVPGWRGLVNRITQRVIALDERYRRAPQRAQEWHTAR